MTDPASTVVQPRVQGYCPACGEKSLVLSPTAHVICSDSLCPKPDAAHRVLSVDEIHHVVQLNTGDFSVEHPLIERATPGSLHNCSLVQYLYSLSAPPQAPGRWRVIDNDGDLTWTRLS